MPPITASFDRLQVQHDRALGCLYGVALGDAMGMPGELWSRARIVDHFGWIDRFLDGPDGHFVVDGFHAGQVTDDTQQMAMLAASIEHAGGVVDPVVLAADLVAWADEVGASEGNFLGPTSAKVIEKLRRGADPLATGVAGTTNGAAMRIAPVGVLCPSSELVELVAQVAASCRIAHNTNIAIAGAAMLAAAISTAIDMPDDGDKAAATRDALDAAVAAARLGMELGEDAAGASLIERTRLGVAAANASDSDSVFLQYLYDVVGASTETTESVPAALSIAARAQGDPLRAAILSANLGGDTDTIGAMAGGVCGAISGFHAIPADLSSTLDQVNRLPLRRLAPRLVAFREARAAAHKPVQGRTL